MNSIPKPGTGAFKVVMAVYDKEPISGESLLTMTGVNKNSLHSTLSKFGMVNNGGMYSLPRSLRMKLNQKYPRSALALPRTTPDFKQISAKNLPPREPRRADAEELRDISFKCGSVGFPLTGWGW